MVRKCIVKQTFVNSYTLYYTYIKLDISLFLLFLIFILTLSLFSAFSIHP